jgi:hypothetical protein
MNLPNEDAEKQPQDQNPDNLPYEAAAGDSPVPGNNFPDEQDALDDLLSEKLELSIETLAEDFDIQDSLEPEFDFSALESNARSNIEELGFAPLPEIERPATSSRRKRARQPLISRFSDEEASARLENMAQRAVPTFDYFIFAVVAGSLLGIGYLLNAPAILLLALVLAPFPAPWVGISLSAATGESRFFGQTLGGFFTAILIVFITGILAGLTSRIFMPILLDQAYLHARLWWTSLLLVALGAVAVVLLFSQKEEKPVLAGLILNYGLLLPISAAGFGLGNGTPGLWPQGLAVFLVHFALAIILGLAIFYYMGFRPFESIGYAWGAGVVIVSLMVVLGFAGLGTLIPIPQPAAIEPSPTSTENPTVTATPSLAPVALATSTPTLELPTITPEPTDTPRPSATLVVIPTTAFGRIQSFTGGDGAVIRVSPGGTAITTILNGYLVEILPDDPVTLDRSVWIKIKFTTASRTIEGWVLQGLIVTPTPQP